MSTPIGIRYYQLFNNGIGTIIYPQLRAVNDPQSNVVWDGRDVSGFKYMITVGNDVIVDLNTEKPLQNLPFRLSCNVVAGVDNWDTTASFVYDPNSNLIAVAQEYGSVYLGNLHFLGTRVFNAAAEERLLAYKKTTPSLTDAIMQELQASTTVTANGLWEFLGVIQWTNANPNIITAAMALVVGLLIARGYEFEYTTQGTNTSVKFRRRRNVQAVDIPLEAKGSSEEVDGQDGLGEKLELTSIPKKVVQDWNDAVNSAARYKPINKGVKEL